MTVNPRHWSFVGFAAVGLIAACIGIAHADSDAVPTMKITTEQGRVCLKWEPDLNSVELTRIYKLYGKTELDGESWASPIQAWHRFFKVEVKEPTGEPGEYTSVSGVSFVPREPLKPGEVINATDPAAFVEPRVEFPVVEVERDYGYVQLWDGGPYWAECNLGATKPEEAGDYFWWGDTVGSKDVGTANFSSETCPSYYDHVSWNRIEARKYLDSNNSLVDTKDAARVKLGTCYRMPTEADFAALKEKCELRWEKRNGVWGQRVVGKGAFADRSIFLPAAGCAIDYDLKEKGENGYYWTSHAVSGYSGSAYYLRYYNEELPRVATRDKFRGQSIRPVKDAPQSKQMALNELGITPATTELSELPYEVIPTDKIEPLIQTEWDQMPPYNLLCPNTFGGTDSTGQYNMGKCATGCMTTALAQIMNFHRYPAHGYGAMRKKINQKETEISFYKHTYNWDAMKAHRRDYQTAGGSYSLDDPSVYAVAELMYDVGVATRQDFGTTSSGANIGVTPALLAQFNYDPSINLVYRDDCADWEEWNRILIEELRAGRPIYIEGLDPARTFGHAFVCDGYDGKGNFHINWGWSGLSNGYFPMTALNPPHQGSGGSNSGYSTGLVIARNIRPRLTEGEPKPEVISCFSDDPADGIGFWSENGIYAGGRFTVTRRYNVLAYMGLLVILPDGQKIRAMNTDNSANAVQILDNNTYFNFKVPLDAAWCRNGTRLYYIYKPVGTSEWKYVLNQNGTHCGLEIRCDRMVESRADFEYVTDDPGVEIEPKAKEPEFPISFDANTDAQRLSGTTNPRYIGTIGLQENGANKVTYQVDPAKVYRNMTETAVFRVTRNASITPSVTMAAGNWMSAYFYIDYGRDGELSFNKNQLSQEGTDVAAYSYWTGDEANGSGGSDSAGKRKNNGNTLEMPSCRAPSDPGTYTIRFKIDWNSVDPAGNATSANPIVSNGGAIVDATLIVE